MKYKIIIEEITEKEIDGMSYENLHIKDEDGKDQWGSVPTGLKKIERNLKEVYSQEKENLDIGDLAIYINRSR